MSPLAPPAEPAPAPQAREQRPRGEAAAPRGARRIEVRALGAGPSPARVAWSLRGAPGLCWLDSGPAGRSLLCWDPIGAVEPGEGWLDRARAALAPRPGPGRPEVSPFAGGLVGWIGYEAGRFVERMPGPVSPPPLPELGLRRFEGGLTWTPTGGWLAAGAPAFVSDAAARLEAARRGPAPDPGEPSGRLIDAGDPAGFLAGVREILAKIRAGDCYQVNLSRRLIFEDVGDPLRAYLRLRALSPAPFGAYLASPGGVVLSNSPELYLEVRGGAVRSEPIKGTCPRGETPSAEAALQRALRESEKERAELTMIVDLVRNDLGRVCEPGSVRASPRRLQTLPTLAHAVQEISGQLAPARDALDAIGASFPPGSVTGAPKVQAMSVIQSLEPAPRGVYTGAIGWLGDGGDASLSVAIRTATVRGGRALVHVGCGIVADSDPERELEESELKARALSAALALGPEAR